MADEIKTNNQQPDQTRTSSLDAMKALREKLDEAFKKIMTEKSGTEPER